MSAENSLIDAALRGWKSNVERAGNLFGTLSPEQLFGLHLKALYPMSVVQSGQS